MIYELKNLTTADVEVIVEGIMLLPMRRSLATYTKLRQQVEAQEIADAAAKAVPAAQSN